MRHPILPALLVTTTVGLLLAQAPAALQMNIVYECPSVQARMQVFSCAGANANDLCDLQTQPRGKPAMRGKSTHQQVMTLMTLCHPQTPAEAKAWASGAPAAAAPGARGGTGPGGFKAGDEIQILTAGGWMNAKILQVNGNSYFVHAANGADVNKSYPAEVRRLGKLTPEDHANGQWDVHDKVQVNVNGQWIEGEISGYFNTDFDVRVAGDRIVHTTVQNLRMSTAPPPAVRSSTQAPKPGLTSCAGKFEGRYAPNQGGGIQLVFRSGKVTAAGPLGGDQEYECWTGGGKVYLYKAGASKEEDSLDINNDGTLEDSAFGEMKKKGN